MFKRILKTIFKKSSPGNTLIELMLAIGLAAVLLPVLLTALVASRSGKAQEQQRLQATAYLQELEIATRSVQERQWSLVATNGTYYPTVVSNAWTLNSGTQTLNGYTRKIEIADVQRNSSGQIVTSGGTVDPSTKQVVATVSWTTPLTTQVSSTFYLTRYLSNATLSQSTQAELSTGNATNTQITNTSGGEVQLNSNNTINWSNLSIIGSYNAAGTTDGLDVFVSGNYAYLVTGTGTPNFLIINITTPSAPTLTGSLTLASQQINGVWVEGNNAYLASNNNNGELLIINVATKTAPALSNTINLTGNADATDVAVANNYAYVTRLTSTATELQLVRLTGLGAPIAEGGYEVGADANSVSIVGTTAYLATDNDTQELMAVNVSNTFFPSLTGSYNAPPATDAMDVAIDATRAALVTTNNASGNEFFLVNITTPASMTLSGSYNVGANVNGVELADNFAQLGTSLANKEFIALNVGNPASITETASLDLDANSNRLFTIGNTAYVSSAHDSRELTIIQTAAGSAYVTNGTFESSSLNAGAAVAFNYLGFNATEPINSDLKIQVATNTDNATWNYVGPDGTVATFYEASDAIPLNRIAGQYLRYKATFTGNGTVTPVLQDMFVNYSP